MVKDCRSSRFVTVLFALATFGSLLAAQEGLQREGRGGPPAKVTPVHRVAGVRDGVSVFPKVDYAQLKPLSAGEVDFKHYHSYEETSALLKMWAAKHPDLVDLYSAGQSFEGRETWQLTITNKKTGRDTDKPAFFLEGGRHAGEISGIEASLYFIHHVLSGYGTDPALTALDDTSRWWCFYKEKGQVRYSWSTDLTTWTPAGVGAGGENPCVIVDGDDYVLFYAPHKGSASSGRKI